MFEPHSPPGRRTTGTAMPHSPDFEEEVTHADQDMDLKDEMELQIALAVEIRKHPMGPVPKWGLSYGKFWRR